MANTFKATVLVLRLSANPAFLPRAVSLLFEGCFVQLLCPKASFWGGLGMSRASKQILLMLL